MVLNFKEARLSSVTTLITKGATPTTYGHDFTDENEDAILFLGAFNCSIEGRIKLDKKKWISKEADKSIKRSRLQKNDSLFCIVGNTIGNSCLIEEKVVPANINQNVALIRPNFKKLNPQFLSYNLRSSRIQWTVIQEASTQAQPSLSLKQVGDFSIPLPPLSEQKKIAKILSIWDEAIVTTEQLLANSQQQKKALMQQLLTGKKRFPGFAEWKTVKLKSFMTESRVPGSSGDVAKKITVKLYGQGVLAKDEKRLGSESTKYYKRSAGQFIYSKLDFLNGAFGIVPSELDGYESTLDLPAFDLNSKVDSSWLINFVSRESFYKSNIGLANGGRKARRVNPKDLLNLKINAPSLEEQKAIAAALNTADAEIATLQQKLDRLKQEKKALMQQLLTGKRRVKVDKEAATA
ncbi:restriction endonuclease subunit S [Pelagicoccus albus]|uniref:Restriction endonuclease subunit S n=1 Tax=Pelagicoccus albus TaxID=415222 RepID=A0A7X1B7Z5_9BACT|nr:restriction endonuclease subunit S [Pelagicoccus albus]MBC2606088.1 restriction endonuclease subunit S [Pelagicoccus albus]